MHDLVLRGGTVHDGTGRPGRRADVAVDGERIVEVGDDVGRGRREIDADGLIVTPGFVDIHTHFDGQATWDPILAPSSWHGVTSVLMGNCGVGFAPAQEAHHDILIELLEGVEDIPAAALAEGLTWNWHTFPEYLDELGSMRRTIDVASLIPHAPLRIFAMGERGADPDELPTEAEIATMAEMVERSIRLGAIGLATSRNRSHRTKAGASIGTMRAEANEVVALCEAVRRTGTGVLQLVSDFYRSTDDEHVAAEMRMLELMATTAGRPFSFTLQEDTDCPDRWREVMRWVDDLNLRGVEARGQIFVRPLGVMLGLQGTVMPFSRCRSYVAIADLPLAERVAAMRDPEIRRRILAEHAEYSRAGGPGITRRLATNFDLMFKLGDPVDYQLDASQSLGEQAKRSGADAAGMVYDALLEMDGRRLLYFPLSNYASRTYDTLEEMVLERNALFGLSDAGAHCGAVSDASHTTSSFITWHRDRRDGPPIDLEWLIHGHTQRNAEYVGWFDRGVVAPGYLADLNVIDLAGLSCAHPEMVYDLPAGGGRLMQTATGYRATVKSGAVTFEHGEHTGELPGELVRGRRDRLDPG